jgi:hypothetical protein
MPAEPAAKRGYHVENRWGNDPWWLTYYFGDGRAKVISKHPSKPAAQAARRRRAA